MAATVGCYKRQPALLYVNDIGIDVRAFIKYVRKHNNNNNDNKPSASSLTRFLVYLKTIQSHFVRQLRCLTGSKIYYVPMVLYLYKYFAQLMSKFSHLESV